MKLPLLLGIGLLLGACTATSEEILKLYPGEERPAYEVVTLKIDSSLVAIEINGRSISRKDFATVTLEAGKYGLSDSSGNSLGFVVYPKRIDDMRPDKPMELRIGHTYIVKSSGEDYLWIEETRRGRVVIGNRP